MSEQHDNNTQTRENEQNSNDNCSNSEMSSADINTTPPATSTEIDQKNLIESNNDKTSTHDDSDARDKDVTDRNDGDQGVKKSKTEDCRPNEKDDNVEQEAAEQPMEASQEKTSSGNDLPQKENDDTHSSNEQLKVDLVKPETTQKETVNAENSVSDGATCSGSNNGSKSPGSSESIYHIKWVHFKKKLVPIITQNENGPCPLLAIMNVLLLQTRVKLAPETEIISANQLMVYLGDCVLENVPGDEGVSTPARLNFEQNMSDAMGVMHKLQTGLDVNVKFTGISHFEYTSECIIFDLLQIALYHGWLVDPQNQAEVTAVGKCSYNQLVEKIITDKTSDQPEFVNHALIAEQFLACSASQLTYHGLCELSSQLKEDELAVLFRNNHFTTLYRQKGELFQLVTDQGFLNETNVVWETLSNVEGDCHFVDSEFRTYTKPEPSLHPVEPPNVQLTNDEQIDQDYLVALSLQQEQQQEPMAWGQSSAPMTDLELAQTLQEEERRAAEEAQRQQQLHQQQMAGRNVAQGQQAQRRQQRGGENRDREEKKSDCQIL